MTQNMKEWPENGQFVCLITILVRSGDLSTIEWQRFSDLMQSKSTYRNRVLRRWKHGSASSPKLIQFVWLSLFSLSLFADSKRPHVIGVFEGIDREIAVEDGELVGRFAAYYQCVFGRVQGDFQFVEMPLAQMLYRLEKGRISAGLPMVQTAERDEYADFGGLLFQTEYVYLLLQDLPPLDSLSGLRFAFVRQFVGDKLLRGADPQVIHVSDWGQAVEMLKRARVDVVVLPGFSSTPI